MARESVADVQEVSRQPELATGERPGYDLLLQRYRNFVTNSTEAIWCVEFDEPISLDLPEMEQVDRMYRHARIVEANESFANAYKTTVEEVLGWRFQTFFSRSLPTSVPFLLDAVRSGYRMRDVDTVERAAEGSEIILCNNFEGTFEDGKVVRVWGTQRDVTQLRRTERLIRLQSAAIEALQSGCILADARAESMPIVYVNEGFTTMTGYAASEVLGRNCRFLQGPDTDPQTRAAIRDSIARGEPFQGEILNYRKDRTPFWNLLRVSPVRDGEGAITHFVGILTDVTERRRKDEETRRLRDELARVGRQATLGELTSAIAHELNQPLTAIASNAGAARRFLALDDPDLEEVREILDDIVADDLRAAEVIRRLRALLGKQKPEQEALDMNEVVRQIVRLLRSEALIRNVSVELELAEKLPPVRGDRIQLQQVLMNLVINGFDAMNETPIEERRLVLSTERCFAEDGEGGEGVRVAVRDFGVGLRGQQPEELFAPFHTTKPNGMGMGLAIVHSIIEAHRGRIQAIEKPERGATFRFTLLVDPSA